MDGQTIRQSNVYSNYIKGSFDFPVEIHNEDDRWYVQRMANEAIELTQFPESGPVHVNLPFREPLYEVKDYSNEELPKLFETTKTLLELPESQVVDLKQQWQSYNRILIITGFLFQFGIFYWTGLSIFSSLLIYQHSLIKHNDLTNINLVFFTTNGIASLIFGAFVITDLLL